MKSILAENDDALCFEHGSGTQAKTHPGACQRTGEL